MELSDEVKSLLNEKSFIKGFSGEEGAKLSVLTDKQKVQLNRKANELFNQKEYEQAKRIYVATGYSDGLARMGDYYIHQKNEVEALKMYVMSKMSSKIEPLAQKTAEVIRGLLQKEDSFRG